MTYRGDGVERPQSRMAWEMNPPEDSTQKKVPGQESNFRWTKFLVDEDVEETSVRAHRVQSMSPVWNRRPERMTEEWGVS